MEIILVLMVVILVAYAVSGEIRYRNDHPEDYVTKEKSNTEDNKFSIGISFNVTIDLPKKQKKEEEAEDNSEETSINCEAEGR